MNNDDIIGLKEAIELNIMPIYYMDGHYCLCCKRIKMDWQEVFYGGTICDIPEPAVELEDGSYVLLLHCNPSSFVTIQNVFTPEAH